MNEKTDNLFRTIDFFCNIVESPNILKEMTIEYMKKSFQACVVIEKAMKMIQDERKEKEFESHLRAWTAQKKKRITYKCSTFQNACDRLLELCLKEEKIPNEWIDELLKLYLQQCGNVRLEANISCILTNSMRANALLQLLNYLKIPVLDVEDEMLIACWEHEINIGCRKKVKESIKNMFIQGDIPKLIKLAYKADHASQVNDSILNFLARKLVDNHIELYTELLNVKKRVIMKLLVDNSKFQICFIDTTFYFGRNMIRDDAGEWTTDEGISYVDLTNIIKVLVDGPEDLNKLIIDRIKLAKQLDIVWEDVEKDCIL